MQSSDVLKLERAAQKVDAEARLLSAWELKGGISAQTVLVVAERPDRSRALAVLRHLSDSWIAAEPERTTATIP